MKKHFYFLAFFLATGIFTQAQIKKGTVLLGGNIGFMTQKTSPINSVQDFSTKQSNFSLNPSVGFAVKDNLVEGFDLTYSGYSSNQAIYNGSQLNLSTERMHSYGAGVFLRQYKYLGNNFYLFMQGHLGGAYATTKWENNPSVTVTEVKESTIFLGFYPGISYAITNKVQLETGFQNLVYAQYTHEKQTFQSQGTGSPSIYPTNVFNLSTSLSNSLAGFVVGFRVLFGS